MDNSHMELNSGESLFIIWRESCSKELVQYPYDLSCYSNNLKPQNIIFVPLFLDKYSWHNRNFISSKSNKTSKFTYGVADIENLVMKFLVSYLNKNCQHNTNTSLKIEL